MAKANSPKSALTALAQTLTVTTPAPSTNHATVFQENRTAAAQASVTEYGAVRKYAQQLVDVFGHNFWRKASPNFKVWQEERTRYDASLKERNHKNPTTALDRLMRYADEICNPPAKTGPKAKSELADRQKKDLITLFKSGRREENKVGLDDTESKAHLGICKILQDVFKVDLSTVK